jgi:cytochrome c oxidase subunit 3
MSSTTQVALAATPRLARSSEATRSGVWVAVFAITMSFAALTSALFVRQGSGEWSHIVVPTVMYVNTLGLLLSSFTMELARRTKPRPSEAGAEAVGRTLVWLAATLGLGIAFVGGQYLAWRHLAAQGLYLATNPNSSFLYVFTGLHALHVLGGVTALLFLIFRLADSHLVFRKQFVDNMAIYWHFMGVLWIYLLFVIQTRL